MVRRFATVFAVTLLSACGTKPPCPTPAGCVASHQGCPAGFGCGGSADLDRPECGCVASTVAGDPTVCCPARPIQ
ncbi:MAG: hypothetical protein JNK82_07220 [Myxococcaceae bacterium]|nr:hypothetical protein [Myxococcaceae bacterium]